jgi:hypothetical protein
MPRMNWWVFSIFTVLLATMQFGLRTLWALPDAFGVAPCLLIILCFFVALWARPLVAWWAAIILGLLTDLAGPQGVVGPSSLSFLAAAYLAVQMRSYIFRESSVGFAVLTLLAGAFSQLVLVGILTLRHAVAGADDLAAGAQVSSLSLLVTGLEESLYTAAVAWPLGWLLSRLRPIWRFENAGGFRRSEPPTT